MVTWEYAQQSVIGSALIDPVVVPLILTECRTEDFSGAYQTCFNGIAELANSGSPVDPVTLLGLLGKDDYHEFIKAMMIATPTAANVSEYIKVCKEQSMLYRLKELGGILGEAHDLEDARKTVDTMNSITVQSVRNKSSSAGDCVQRWFDRLNAGEEPEYIRCGIGCLDATVKTRPGNYHILAGYTSHGKSALAIQMAWAMSKEHKVGFYCYETPEEEWTERLISHVGQIPLDGVQKLKLSNSDTIKATAACAQIWNRKLSYRQASGMGVSEIRADCLLNGYEIIFVDYLQKVTPPSNKFGRVQEVSDISGGLQQMALQLGVVVFALSQLNRQMKSMDEFIPLPGLPDLRESGQIEQDADAVIFVHAPLRFTAPDMRILSVAKNRHGELRRYFATFAGEKQTFGEPKPEQLQTYNQLCKPKNSKAKDDNGASFARREGAKRREAAKTGEDYHPVSLYDMAAGAAEK